MTTHLDSWLQGTPCWVDFMATDLERSQAFYSRLFGWTYSDSAPEYGGYCNALVRELPVAGMSPTMEGMENAPHVWSVYLATNDIAATATAAADAGAKELYPPMEVAPFGWMGMWIDPSGAAFGAWQSAQHTGFNVTEEHGSPVWCDLMSRDYAAARDFYAKVFGYTYDDTPLSTGMTYSMFSVPGGETAAGGIGDLSGDPGPMPSAWSVCFQVDDVDATAKLIPEAGGAVISEPADFEYGRLCIASGPDGEVFALLTPPKQA